MARFDVPGWERSITEWAVDLPSWTTPALRAVMQGGNRLAPIAVAVVLALALRWRWDAVAVAAGGLLAWAVAEVTKVVVDRPRPTTATLGRPVRDVVTGPGFPSSHAAVATAVCTVVGLLLARRTPAVVVVLVAVPVLTGLGRMHVGAHWFLDVVGGAAVGLVVGSATARVVEVRR